MRIGLITGEYPPMQGGVGAYSAIMAKELTQQGNIVCVLSGELAKSDNNITVENWGVGSLRTIRKWAISQQLDIVNLQFQTAAFGMSPWVHFLPEVLGKIPLVTTFHDLRHPYLFPKAGRLRDWIVMRLAHKSDGVIFTNQEDQLRLQALSKTVLIPIGSNILKKLPPDFDPQKWRKMLGAKDGDFLLTYFGLFNRSKGLEGLLQAVANLRQKGIPLRLVMIGSIGTSDITNAGYLHEINRLVEKLDLQANIHRTGYVVEEHVGAILSATDAVVLPFADGASYRRGSLMAAIHYKTAIITTAPQVSIPALKNGKNMLLVKPNDSAMLEVAIQRLYESPQLRSDLAKGAGELARLFEWKQIARDTTNYFRWVIEESAGT